MMGIPSPVYWRRTVRCARAVRKFGCFPPPVATGPRVLTSAPPILFWNGSCTLLEVGGLQGCSRDKH